MSLDTFFGGQASVD